MQQVDSLKHDDTGAQALLTSWSSVAYNNISSFQGSSKKQQAKVTKQTD